jgi:hypothetical protein
VFHNGKPKLVETVAIQTEVSFMTWGIRTNRLSGRLIRSYAVRGWFRTTSPK